LTTTVLGYIIIVMIMRGFRLVKIGGCPYYSPYYSPLIPVPIIPLLFPRTSAAPILLEQTVGRGLRLKKLRDKVKKLDFSGQV